jgi:Na+-transporting NADH:ubiquinone oxidoreductase subunit A
MFKIRKGLDIRIKGKADEKLLGEISTYNFAVRPHDFQGINPKLKVKVGQNIKQGEIIFFDKYRELVKIPSPVSGFVKDIVRGEKRKILEIIIEKDENNPLKHEVNNLDFSDKEQITNFLSDTGLISLFIQRPYGIVANPEDRPRDIFINFFDSAPLAPNYDFILKDKKNEIQKALEFLSFLTEGKIYCSLKPNSILKDFIPNNEKIEINYFAGPHPSGLVGTHINKIKPINKGEIVWTLNAYDLPIIGNLLINGVLELERIIALTGSSLENTGYYKITACSNLESNNLKLKNNEKVRIISGNVLNGINISESPYFGFYENMISIIPEGDKYEFLGWALPGLKKFSNSGAFLSGLLKFGKYNLNTNINGGQRAYVVTGEYEKVCPLNIYPQLLLKAIITNDIDKMEQLGIYEVIEEDFALCEFVCSSKIDVQELIRQGLDEMRKEMA